MSAIVFVGPSLDASTARTLLPEATLLPPCALGDVYAAARHAPPAIVIIDGYFDRVPAVWHKEILWALSRGVPVYGASSMGALRAAELDVFGMTGIGEVYEAFATGLLEDDDEVALLHAPAEAGYACASEAMVNVRATVAAAREAGVIDAALHDLLVAHAKAAYYAEREYDRLLAVVREAGADAAACESFVAWLPSGRRDVKRDDAIRVLTQVRADLESGAAREPVGFTFQHTSAWDSLRRSVDRDPIARGAGTEARLDDDLLDELRLEGEAYAQARERALLHLLAVETSHRDGVLPAGGAVADDEARARAVAARYRPLLPRALRDHLRAAGRYHSLEARAREKQAYLWRRGAHEPSLAQAGLTEAELWRWFFGDRLGRPVPDDLTAAALALDCPNLDLLRRTALREWIYRNRPQ